MKKVLFVEDNAHLVLILSKQLTACGVSVDVAHTGLEAFRKATGPDRDSYCMVFMDLGLPVLDGLNTTQMIRKFESENSLYRMPIVALTAFGDKRDESFAAGMDGYLLKPIQLDKLKQIIDAFAHIRPVVGPS